MDSELFREQYAISNGTNKQRFTAPKGSARRADEKKQARMRKGVTLVAISRFTFGSYIWKSYWEI